MIREVMITVKREWTRMFYSLPKEALGKCREALLIHCLAVQVREGHGAPQQGDIV